MRLPGRPCKGGRVHIGVLGGTGPAGRAVAARLASSGCDVTVGSRAKERAQEACDELRARWPDRDLSLQPGDNLAAADADVVIVATPWDAASTTAESVAERLQAKVVVSMANALAKVGAEFLALIPPRGSVAAGVQAAVPGALVVAALQHLPARELADLDRSLESDVLVCSDHPRAIVMATEMIERVPGLRVLDAGRLSSAAAIEAMTPVLLGLNVRYKTLASIRVTGIKPRA
jgi:8-hydroxy-5-deazaflavin:NADPH oxidoreductase